MTSFESNNEFSNPSYFIGSELNNKFNFNICNSNTYDSNTYDSSICDHLELENGTCTQCGIVIQMMCPGNIKEYSNNHSMPAKREKTIMTDLQDHDFPEDIKIKANSIFRKLKLEIKRKAQRKQVVFFCLYEAYYLIGSAVDPAYLRDKLGMAPGEETRAFKTCSQLETGYHARCSMITPIDLLPFYCSQLGIHQDSLDAIKEIGIDILSKSSELKETTPQIIAGGLIVYYSRTNGLDISINTIAQIVHFSEAIIKKNYELIQKIHNQ